MHFYRFLRHTHSSVIIFTNNKRFEEAKSQHRQIQGKRPVLSHRIGARDRNHTRARQQPKNKRKPTTHFNQNKLSNYISTYYQTHNQQHQYKEQQGAKTVQPDTCKQHHKFTYNKLYHNRLSHNITDKQGNTRDKELILPERIYLYYFAFRVNYIIFAQ